MLPNSRIDMKRYVETENNHNVTHASTLDKLIKKFYNVIKPRVFLSRSVHPLMPCYTYMGNCL